MSATIKMTDKGEGNIGNIDTWYAFGSTLPFCIFWFSPFSSRPSSAKYSDWRLISVVLDATNELIVSKPSAGGQSTKIISKLL